MPIQVIILLGLGITAVIWFLKKQLDSDYEQEVVLVDSTTDPVMKAVAEQRTTFMNNVITALMNAWQVDMEDLDVDAEQLSFNTSLISIIYQNHMLRLYCNWKRHTMRIHYITNHRGKTKIIRKRMRIGVNSVDFEKMQLFFCSIKPVKTISTLTEAQVDKFINAAKELKGDGKISHDDANSMLIEFWDESKNSVMKEGTRENIMQFTAMTTLLYEYCPDEFEKHLSEIKDHEQIPKSHESAD